MSGMWGFGNHGRAATPEPAPDPAPRVVSPEVRLKYRLLQEASVEKRYQNQLESALITAVLTERAPVVGVLYESVPAVRKWVRKHPDQAVKLLDAFAPVKKPD